LLALDRFDHPWMTIVIEARDARENSAAVCLIVASD